jgi:hypothetical protein
VTKTDTNGMQLVAVVRFPESRERTQLVVKQCSLPATALPIRDVDIVCFLQGASKPAIIRPHHHCDHLKIVMIEPTTLGVMKPASPLRDFLLVWDWSRDPNGRIRASQALGRGKLTRLVHTTLVLKDVKAHLEAEKRMISAIYTNERSFKDKRWFQITPQELSEVMSDLSDEVVVALLDRVRHQLHLTVEIQASTYKRCRTHAVNLALGLTWEVSSAVFEGSAKILNHDVLGHLVSLKGPTNITDAVVEAVARTHSEQAMECILSHRAVEVTEAVAKAVAKAVTATTETRPRAVISTTSQFRGYQNQKSMLLLLLCRNIATYEEPCRKPSRHVRMTEGLLVHMVSRFDRDMVCRLFE